MKLTKLSSCSKRIDDRTDYHLSGAFVRFLMPSTYMLCDALDSLMKRFNARSFDLKKYDGTDRLS